MILLSRYVFCFTYCVWSFFCKCPVVLGSYTTYPICNRISETFMLVAVIFGCRTSRYLSLCFQALQSYLRRVHPSPISIISSSLSNSSWAICDHPDTHTSHQNNHRGSHSRYVGFGSVLFVIGGCRAGIKSKRMEWKFSKVLKLTALR